MRRRAARHDAGAWRSDARSRLRAALSPWLPTLPQVSAMAATTGLIWFLVRWWYPVGPPALGWVPLPITTLLAAAATAQVSRDPRLAGAVRRFWRHVSIAAVVMTAAVLTNAHESLTASGGPAPVLGALTVALFVLAFLSFLYGLVRLPVHNRPNKQWLTVGLDVAIIGGAAVIILWHFTAGDGGGRSGPGTGAIWLAMILLSLAGIRAATKVGLHSGSGVNAHAMWLLGGVTVLGLVIGSGSVLLAGRPELSALMIAVPAVYCGVSIAAGFQLEEPVRGVPAGPQHATGTGRRRRRRAFSMVPYAAVTGTNLLLLVATDDTRRNTRTMIIGTVALTALVVVRQVVAFRENAELLARVDASLLEMRHNERRFRSLVQNSDDVISIVTPDGRLLYTSPGIHRVLGMEPDRMEGADARPDVHPDDLRVIKGMFDQLAGHPNLSVRGQVRIRHADGSWRWFEVTYTNLLHDPSVRGFVSNARDISDNRYYQDQLAYQAAHDELTGLANRTLFTARTERAVTGAAPGTVAVILIDLDDFKGINDRLGHTVGDALLVAVSSRLRAGMRPQDTVARLGGDEFGILLTSMRPGESELTAERIQGALAEPVRAGNHELLIQASIGLAEHNADTATEDLLRHADIAMYAAKELGKNRYVHYDADLDARTVEHAQLAAELSQALDRDELRLHYQPIVELPTGRIVGVEALVRWEHPTGGLVSPARFIPVAERTGLIVPLGAWVLRTACQQAADWKRRFGAAAPQRMSVNVSARQLMEPTLPQTVATALIDTGLDPTILTVEITETAVFGGGRSVETVAAIHAQGVSIALDDFGTGHSSLGLLRTCPVDVLKVDKSFVDGVTGTVEQEAIATSIVEIAHALGMQAVAEGVETGAQADRLYELGYRFAQGFHFARPAPAGEVEKLLNRDFRSAA